MLTALFGAVLVAPARPAAAAGSATLSIAPLVGTMQSGGQVQFTIPFQVSGGTLDDVRIQVRLPRGQFRAANTFFSGGTSSTVTTDTAGALATVTLGTLTEGTIGSVQLFTDAIQYAPNNTEITATAKLLATGYESAEATSTITLVAAATPAVEKSGFGYLAAPGPAGTAVAGQPGFNAFYSISAVNDCTGLGCLPARGVLTDTLPPGTYLVSASRTQAYVDRATGAPDGPGFIFPADIPLGLDIGDVPPAGSQGSFSLDVYLHPSDALQMTDGRYRQFDYQDDLAATPVPMSNRFVRSPVLDVVIWVPDALVPPEGGGPYDADNTARLQVADIGNGNSFDAQSNAIVKIERNPQPQFGKGVFGCTGYGTGPTSAYDPATGVGNESCVIGDGSGAQFPISINSSVGFLVNPRVTDRLPDELRTTGAFAPGYTTSFNDDADCGPNTPDAAFTEFPPVGGARCVRLSADGVVQNATAQVQAQTVESLDLAAGTFRRVRNQAWLRGPQFAADTLAEQDVAIVDRSTVSIFHSVVSYEPDEFGGTIPGGIVTFEMRARPLVSQKTDASPHDFTITNELWFNQTLTFLSADVIDAPLLTSGEISSPTCSYNAGLRQLVCVAPGDTANRRPDGGTNFFTVQMRARVAPGTPASNAWTNHSCSYSQPTPGSPQNGAGHYIAYQHAWFPGTSLCPFDFAGPRVAWWGTFYTVGAQPPPPPGNSGNPLLNVDKLRIAPLGSSVDGGDTVTYRLVYDHLPSSTGDISGGYIYDFLGRDPVSGQALGDVVPEFASASVEGLETIEYTCTPNSSLANNAVVWETTPCAGVTGVRFQPRSIVAPNDPPGSYRVEDPAARHQIVVRVPSDASPGDLLVNAVGISATGLPAATGEVMTIRVGGEPPVANNVDQTLFDDSTLELDLPTLASDPDQDLVADDTSIINVSSGTATWDAARDRLVYTPSPTFTGRTATIDFRVCDATEQCDEGRITVTFIRSPHATDDSATVANNDSVIVDTYANDTDPDSNLDRDSFEIFSGFSHGTVSLSAGGAGNPGPGVFRYTPEAGFVGEDRAIYRICDDDEMCDEADVVITVVAPEEASAPNAVDDDASVNEGAAVVLDPAANDTDADGDLDRSTLRIVTPPTRGTATVGANGLVTYTSTGGPGADSFVYEICDATERCDTATVRVTVNDLVRAPVANDDTASVDEGGTVVINVVANDTDADGDLEPSSVRVTRSPALISVTDQGNGNLMLSNTATRGFDDDFDYEVCDSTGRCDTATVNVTVNDVAQPPDAVDDNASVNEGAAAVLDPAANDTDADGDLDRSTLRIVTPPANGTATVGANGLVTYTSTGAPGPDSFAYEICDATERCDTATVRVTVNDLPHAPVANDDTVVAQPGQPTVVDVLANDTDEDGDIDPACVTITRPPTKGTAVVNPETGVITYTATAGATGSDSFEYRVCDSGGRADTASASVVLRSPPVANDDEIHGRPATSTPLNLLANDTDLDGDLDPQSLTFVTPPQHGQLSQDPVTHALSYRPGTGWVGADSFTYRVCDLTALCDTATAVVVTDAVMTARAYGAGLGGPLLALLGLPGTTFGDTGEVRVTTDSHVHRETLGQAIGPIGLRLLSGDVDAVTAGGSHVTAVGRVASATITLSPLNKLEIIGVEATSTSACSGRTGSGTVATIKLNGRVVYDARSRPAPVNLGVARIAINEQTAGPDGLTVIGVRVSAPGIADVVLGYARSNIDCG